MVISKRVCLCLIYLPLFLHIGLLGVSLRENRHKLADGHAASTRYQARQPRNHHLLGSAVDSSHAQHKRRDRNQPIVGAQHQSSQPRRPMRVVLVAAELVCGRVVLLLLVRHLRPGQACLVLQHSRFYVAGLCHAQIMVPVFVRWRIVEVLGNHVCC